MSLPLFIPAPTTDIEVLDFEPYYITNKIPNKKNSYEVTKCDTDDNRLNCNVEIYVVLEDMELLFDVPKVGQTYGIGEEVFIGYSGIVFGIKCPKYCEIGYTRFFLLGFKEQNDQTISHHLANTDIKGYYLKLSFKVLKSDNIHDICFVFENGDVDNLGPGTRKRGTITIVHKTKGNVS
ncbi:MAG: hypothetical protein AAGA77_24495 [Bacteroidota bacterium]